MAFTHYILYPLSINHAQIALIFDVRVCSGWARRKTQTQLDELSENEDWSNRYYQQVKDEEDNAIVRKVKKLSEGTTDVRICRNNITLTVGDEKIWSCLNKSDKKRIEMTMASTFDLSNTAKGLTAGIYRIDFYMQSGKIDSENFYNQSKFPVPSKTIHFEVK